MAETHTATDCEGLLQNQRELLVLAELAGVSADPRVVKIVIELLNMKIPPKKVYKMLRTIRRSGQLHADGAKQNRKSTGAT